MITASNAFFIPLDASAQQEPVNPVEIQAEKHDTSAPLRELALQAASLPQPIPADQEPVEIPMFSLAPQTVESAAPVPDALRQALVPSAPIFAETANFEGVNNRNGVLPPDTVGDIGPNHYVQMVNLSFAVWDRNENLLLGPLNNNTLWSGFGGVCETTNRGDPVVNYDHLADRWVMSQFAFTISSSGPYYECVAVSATPDPTGAWHRYAFLISSTKLNDYPKIGVWPDGYYLSFNQFLNGSSWSGQGVAVLERSQMLDGNAADMVYFDLFSQDSTLNSLLPADLEGSYPIANIPNPYVGLDKNTLFATTNKLEIWKFHVDWATPANSTFTFDRTIDTAAFDSSLCGGSRTCIPQPSNPPPSMPSVGVDPISDRLMYRAAFRNFGSYQAMVLNHTVDVGTNHAGIRWYELRDSGSGWSIYQQGTFAPDSDHRWMGSIAMNRYGDIALGYSVSSTTTYPSIRITGRLAGDPLGQITFAEHEVITGSGYQTHSSSRWGDYSAMVVDPTDRCTFWYTQEFYATIGSAPWKTQISAVQLRSCEVQPRLYFPILFRTD